MQGDANKTMTKEQLYDNLDRVLKDRKITFLGGNMHFSSRGNHGKTIIEFRPVDLSPFGQRHALREHLDKELANMRVTGLDVRHHLSDEPAFDSKGNEMPWRTSELTGSGTITIEYTEMPNEEATDGLTDELRAMAKRLGETLGIPSKFKYDDITECLVLICKALADMREEA